jgi:hypothetical protein
MKVWLFAEVDIIEMHQAGAHFSRAKMPALPGEAFVLSSLNHEGAGLIDGGRMRLCRGVAEIRQRTRGGAA